MNKEKIAIYEELIGNLVGLVAMLLTQKQETAAKIIDAQISYLKGRIEELKKDEI